GLGVDGPETPIGPRTHPGDVVAHRPHLPALLRRRRDEHGEVRLAARAREGGGDVVRLALGALHADDQHVLGEPAFLARLYARDAEREALLAEQRVAAVAGADRPDELLLRAMADEAPP